jgi:hypothetical protein
MNKQQKRAKAISEVLRSWAFDEGKSYFMGFWDMADNLNNSWFAPLFISSKYKDKQHETVFKNGETQWSIPSYDEYKFRRMINWTVKRMGGKIIKQGYNEFYRFPKKVVQK